MNVQLKKTGLYALYSEFINPILKWKLKENIIRLKEEF